MANHPRLITRAAPVSRIVVTGGPCSGKTTLVARIGKRIEATGIRPYPVSEAATLMIAAGARTRATQGDAMLLFQRNVVRVQLALEDAIFEIAATNTPAAIVHDRGVFDAAGFLEPTQWKILLND